MNKTYDAAVIGAGAAGMLCAGKLAAGGLNVVLIEKNNRPGKKLLITGKGRCNVTNNCTVEEFLAAVRTNSKFLYSAAYSFAPADTMQFFESLGVPLKTERGARVFPKSDCAQDVVAALAGYCKKNGVHFYEGSAKDIIKENLQTYAIIVGKEKIKAKTVVVATGGLSYPATGSTGDGYRFAKAAGHTVTDIRPSLVPIVTKEKWCTELMGLSLKNVTLTVKERGKKEVYSELGEMLFTHFGISGPLVLSASSHMKKQPNCYDVFIDLKPALSQKQLNDRLLRDFDKNINKDFANALGALLPQKMIPVAVRLSGIDEKLKVNQITKEMRQSLVEVLKNLKITPHSFRPVKEAIITAGGVKTAEIEPGTMQSKKQAGLYFIGEVLDLDAYTGGYNLQIAFCTANTCADAILQNIQR